MGKTLQASIFNKLGAVGAGHNNLPNIVSYSPYISNNHRFQASAASYGFMVLSFAGASSCHVLMLPVRNLLYHLIDVPLSILFHRPTCKIVLHSR